VAIWMSGRKRWLGVDWYRWCVEWKWIHLINQSFHYCYWLLTFVSSRRRKNVLSFENYCLLIVLRSDFLLGILHFSFFFLFYLLSLCNLFCLLLRLCLLVCLDILINFILNLKILIFILKVIVLRKSFYF
jgi:hypothetical protein